MANKDFITVNKAGIDSHNPILVGVKKELVFSFSLPVQYISGYVDNESPADANAITFEQVSTSEYKIDFIAGTTPFTFVDELSYMRILATGANGVTEIEKSLYIASVPSYPIHLYNHDNQLWENAKQNYSQKAVIVCGVKILDAYQDEFRYRTYGGYKLISVYDGGTNEDDTSETWVRRQLNQKAQNVKQIYLIKTVSGGIESHWIRFKFKNSETDTHGFTHDIKIQTVDCFGFFLKNPLYTTY